MRTVKRAPGYEICKIDENGAESMKIKRNIYLMYGISLLQAAVLLRQTQGTIADIANQVGYENQSKFATAFREIMKVSPKEYRGQYRIGGNITD